MGSREVHPQQPDERATAFFRALDQYNRALEEDLEVAAVRVENDSGLRPARADRRRQSSRSIPKPDDQGTAVSQGGNDVNEEDPWVEAWV
ncbi:hypothetical protein Pmar_PMAR024487 [Perkinsus marinus ATCC 50983]|uniref:Uncharacterized protein n=1 Tax=Perkinsus marinus (strain ATCC 50983 / TXsc) TaxID=423536 RepID=C5LT42_PERM5|nr:hypothetical protein Pmar_PMAR024487 [Perkinsus marinus ATCC 50983]EER00010.1 hypothetical protein Pmar_PMAR024487 [Perkinsus marinus ATCC 50983]|eukprot:XP_002767292.1 hypothetical protein Pmar_PMAR024487 [Perkinsus marinus ATCC 50983]